MTVKASVIYPNNDDIKFDLDYYLKTHMPLVAKQWGPHGLKSWEVLQYSQGVGEEKPKYAIEAILEWESEGAISTAVASEAAKIVFGDVPNFTNVQPVFSRGKIVGSSKV